MKLKPEIKKERFPQWDNKNWVACYFDDGLWVPSVREIGTILRLIGQCEKEKYPNGFGRGYFHDFCYKAIMLESMTIDELAIKFETPQRTKYRSPFGPEVNEYGSYIEE